MSGERHPKPSHHQGLGETQLLLGNHTGWAGGGREGSREGRVGGWVALVRGWSSRHLRKLATGTQDTGKPTRLGGRESDATAWIFLEETTFHTVGVL